MGGDACIRELAVAGLDGVFAVAEWHMRVGAPDGSFMAAAADDRDRWLGASRRYTPDLAVLAAAAVEHHHPAEDV